MTATRTKKAKGIGAALAPITGTEEPSQLIDIDAIVQWTPYNRRAQQASAGDDIAELSASILLHGVQQPILVRPLMSVNGELQTYEGVFGSRRTRASKLAGRTNIPAIVKELTDAQIVEIVTIENLQRRDLDPLEESDQIAQVLAMNENETAAGIAQRISKDVRTVRRSLQLQKLSPAAREAVVSGKLKTFGVIFQLARMSAADQDELLPIATGARQRWNNSKGSGREISVSELQDHIARNYSQNLANAPWKLDDATLVPDAGACTTCPKRSGTEPDLFNDVDGKNVCGDAKCFETKHSAFVQLRYNASVEKTRDGNGDADPVVPVAFRYSNEKRKGEPSLASPLMQDEFIVVRSGSKCDSAERAFVVDGGHSEKTGAEINICRDAKCKVHRGVSLSSGRTASQAERARAKKLRDEKIARGAVLAATLSLFTKGRSLTRRDREEIALGVFGRLWNDAEKPVLAMLGIDPKTVAKPKYLAVSDYASDRDKAIAGWIEKASDAQLNVLLLACTYTPLTNGDSPSTRKQLDAFAKRHAINVDKVRKTALAPKEKAAKPKQSKVQPKAKSAKRAK